MVNKNLSIDISGLRTFGMKFERRIGAVYVYGDNTESMNFVQNVLNMECLVYDKVLVCK